MVILELVFSMPQNTDVRIWSIPAPSCTGLPDYLASKANVNSRFGGTPYHVFESKILGVEEGSRQFKRINHRLRLNEADMRLTSVQRMPTHQPSEIGGHCEGARSMYVLHILTGSLIPAEVVFGEMIPMRIP